MRDFEAHEQGMHAGANQFGPSRTVPFSRLGSGNPAVMGRRAPFRPETLRPQLWLGLPFYRTLLRRCHYTVVIVSVKYKVKAWSGSISLVAIFVRARLPRAAAPEHRPAGRREARPGGSLQFGQTCPASYALAADASSACRRLS